MFQILVHILLSLTDVLKAPNINKAPPVTVPLSNTLFRVKSEY